MIWQPEHFERECISSGEVDIFINKLRERIKNHFNDYEESIFMHPQEIVGCMYGQLLKLSAAADSSIYTGDLVEFRERCMKTLLAILVGTISVDKLANLRGENK